MRYLVVKNFFDFQHYTDRNPPWIKLHYRLIGNLDFKRLSEASQIHLVLIWLLASRHDNKIPLDEPYIRSAIGAKRKIDLRALVDAGFLVVVRDSPGASTESIPGDSTGSRPGASGTTNAREEESEDSEQPPPLPADVREAEVALAMRLPTDAGRVALTALVRALGKHARNWISEMQVMLEGMAGHHVVTLTQLDEALRDYVANGAHEHPNLRQFRRYVRSVVESQRNGSAPATNGNGHRLPRRGGTAARTFQNGVEALKDLP